MKRHLFFSVSFGRVSAEPEPQRSVPGIRNSAVHSLEERVRHFRWAIGAEPRKPKKVDRRHGQELGIGPEVGVVLHARRCDKELPRTTPLEELQRVLRWYEIVFFTVDEQGRALHIRD